jgi:hypothetical protein
MADIAEVWRRGKMMVSDPILVWSVFSGIRLVDDPKTECSDQLTIRDKGTPGHHYHTELPCSAIADPGISGNEKPLKPTYHRAMKKAYTSGHKANRRRTVVYRSGSEGSSPRRN